MYGRNEERKKKEKGRRNEKRKEEKRKKERKKLNIDARKLRGRNESRNFKCKP